MSHLKMHRCRGCCCKKKQALKIPTLNKEEAEILEDLKKFHYLPLCRLVITQKDESTRHYVAADALYFTPFAEDINALKQWGLALKSLAQKAIITLDYQIPLKGFDYQQYENYALYRELQAAAATAAKREGLNPNHTELECGSIALTARGEELIDYIPSP